MPVSFLSLKLRSNPNGKGGVHCMTTLNVLDKLSVRQ